MISKGKRFDVRLSATAKEHMPMCNAKVNNDGKEIKEKKEGKWIVPKHAPIDYFCMKYKNAEEKKESRNNNRCKVLQYNDDEDMNEEGNESENFKVEREITRKDVKQMKKNRMK